MDARFHCSHSARRSAKKSKHRILDCCKTLQQVLALNPDHGVAIPGWRGLRKMRLMVPGLNAGKRGGYRLVYRAAMIDEVWHIVFLRAYFKGDAEDLSHEEYRVLEDESEAILSTPLNYAWENV